MKKSVKKLITMMLMITLLIAMGIKEVRAVEATATATLEASETTVKAGESFTVTLKVSSDQGLNGVISEIKYDTEKLELTSAVAGTNWSNLSTGTKLDLITSSDNLKNSDVYTMTFKVKSGATGEIQIKTGTILVDTMLQGNDSSVNIEEKTVKVTIGEEATEEKILTGIEITKEPTKKAYTEGEKFDTTGMVVTAKYSDGTSKEITNYTFDLNSALKKTDKKVVITYKEGKVTKTAEQTITVTNKTTGTEQGTNNKITVTTTKKDNTVSDKEYPKTGAERIIVPIVLLATIVGISYLTNKKYKKI